MTQASEEFRVPSALRAEVERICVLTDALCVEHLDAEYARLCRKLVAKLARKRPSRRRLLAARAARAQSACLARYGERCRRRRARVAARDPGRGGPPWPDPRVAGGGRSLVIRSRPVGLRTGDGA